MTHFDVGDAATSCLKLRGRTDASRTSRFGNDCPDRRCEGRRDFAALAAMRRLHPHFRISKAKEEMNDRVTNRPSEDE